ncbi:MAG: YfiR family protein [Alphaproteobacteria bacterium]
MAVLKRPASLIAVLGLLVWCFSAQAAGLVLQENEIKAGMLYNFLKYIEWPDEKLGASPAISICLFGGDPFKGYLDKTRGKTVHQKPITVKNVSSAQEVSLCNLLYISDGKREQWAAIAPQLKGRGVLTVSSFQGFARGGGMIEFGRENERIKVMLNLGAVKGASLKVQPRLLRLVEVVEGRE